VIQLPPQSSFASAFHRFPAVVAELVLLTGKTAEDTSAAVLDTGAESFGVGAARSSIVRLAFLRKRQGGKRCKCDGRNQGNMAYHWFASVQRIAPLFF
jgi:hypothetical protein